MSSGDLPHVTVLDSGWTLSHLGGAPAPFPIEEIDARVPGCVHTDLLEAGLIADPFHGTNEHLTDWIGLSDVRYRCRFATPAGTPPRTPSEPFEPTSESSEAYETAGPSERVTLRFEGVDTVADIVLNGTLLGRVADMHRSYDFDVTDLLRPGLPQDAGGSPAETGAPDCNVLDVVIHAPVTAAREAARRIGDRPQTGNAHPFNAIRKMACNFGWDWGPDLATSGLFRPVQLIRWRTARLRDPLSVVAAVAPGAGGQVGTVRVQPFVDLDPAATLATADLTVDVCLTDPQGRTLATARHRLTGADDVTLQAPDPRLWWPVGEGDQPLYRVDVSLVGPDGRVLDRRSRRVGFRSVELITRPDEDGTSFTVRVNGRDLFLRGANWIPDDVFVSRIGHQNYRRGIADALDAHMNVLRIWGGGLFADEWMLERCDEVGLMIWQDFPFACAAYAEEPELSRQVEAEAVENVIRMSVHPSLILWNGSNETIEGYVHWGWQDHLAPDQSWGLDYYTRLLPEIVAHWDGTRPYTPTSPFNPVDLMDPRNPDHGSVHSWQVWNQLDQTHYRDSVPRFCAEFGFQGPAERATLAEYLDDDPLTASSPGMVLHEKAADGLRKLEDGYAPHLPRPVDFEDWHFTTSLNQARAIECGISWFRSWWPRCAGSIIWQLNDCWPVSSWAAVDSRGRRKLLWYALRDLYDDHFLTIQPRTTDGLGGVPTVVASNLAGSAWEQTLSVQRCDLGGRVLDSLTTPVVVGPRDNLTIALPQSLITPADPSRELIVAQLGDRRALWWFVGDIDLALEPADLDIIPGEAMITVTAHNLVKDLCLLCGPGDPVLTSGRRRLTLLPGQTAVLHLDSARPGDSTRPAGPRLRSVNDLLEAARRRR
ncbi:MAG: glycoside hydrolase family 2 protein [Acidipropionibacterium jensenii]|uniref:glycoside hydrolase family 2 protein n=3 Tax=Acidipropionibacterium jensenii TaxID=1749 RepID=UPI002649721E|nr:glycoside hydrolase family 2 protein [Acidipropionibacterium jensenii]MDN5977376.1 glycoside hydrolase family 2 protein [Acidipropionibacterium jensenii]